MPIVLPCATIFALLVATSVVQAQIPGYAGFYEPEPYLSVVEPLLPADPLPLSQFNQPPAAIGTFVFDFLVLDRSHVDPFNLVTVDGTDVLDASDFNFNETGAIRFSATIPSPCGVNLQFSYLGSHEFSARETFSGGVVQDQFFGTFGTQTQLEMTYEAPLDSFELNLRARQWERFSPMAGVRWVTLDESSTQLDIPNNLAFWGHSKNTMVGVQFGGEWLMGRIGLWRFESVLKAGVYYNDMNIEATTDLTYFNRKFRTTSFLGELSAMAVYEFTPYMSLRIGYQGLWMEGTALLFDQYDNFLYTTGNGSVDLGNVNFQGGYVGFDVTW
ncbi:MAG: hypothetical protein QGG71_23045 [Pirellulaceae bacterium]|jgi:hypothetical protein|nr:hypothetical protein [Pirellulaceae bacterium]